MEKTTIQEIARILIDKNGLEGQEAEKFAATMFAVIRDNLENGQQVKVRGLGTFKIVEVGARESVNVNTGERVLIAGHEKISFTPDATMKELVNKPFSQFDTVVLNDGVVFDDTPEKATPEIDVPEIDVSEIETPEVEAPKVEVSEVEIPEIETPEVNNPEVKTPEVEVPETETSEIEAPEDVPAESEQEVKQEVVPPPIPVMAAAVPNIPTPVPDVPIPAQEDQSSEENVAEPEQEDKSLEENVAEPEPETPKHVAEPASYSYDEEESNGRGMHWLLIVLIVLILMAASAVAGYYFGLQQGRRQTETVTIAVPDSTVLAPVDTTAVDTTAIVPVDTTASTVEPTETEQVAKPQPEEPVAEAPATQTVESDKYAEMDPRVKHGAYRIIGEDFTVKVRPGDTTQRIAKRTLGAGMECYIEVYNGIKSNSELKEGQIVKIPKLEWKKKRKK